MSSDHKHGAHHADQVMLYALQALSAEESAAVEADLAACEACRHELEALRPVADSFAHWPTNVLRPTAPLWNRVAERIGQSDTAPESVRDDWTEPPWTQAAPGLWYQLHSVDEASGRVSLVVRLEPGAEYPGHVHAGVEELHLLDGELWIDDRKLHPGDYNRAEPGTGDQRVWSETGCTCVLVTSHRDMLK